jgi:hypothetical protein
LERIISFEIYILYIFQIYPNMYIIKHQSLKIVVISFFIFLFINLIENIIHYNIGKYSKDARGENGSFLHFNMPNNTDWMKIVFVMVIFALSQGVLTAFFNKYL